MNIWLSIIILVVVLLGALLLLIYERKCVNSNKHDIMSFKEALDLTNLPIVTFVNNKKKFNFLLDTGSNRSVINESSLKDCAYKKIDGVNTLSGLDGVERIVNNVSLDLCYKGKIYEETFQVTDLAPAVKSLKEETGVNLHGILGNQFFQNYRYILNFDEMIAYSKNS